MRAPLQAAVPAALVALLALWSGTFHGAASAAGAAATQLALLTAVAWAGGGRDPLRLGAAWWLPWALVTTVAASTALSPVPRAGWETVLLLPAWLWLPAALAHAWRTAVGPERQDRSGREARLEEGLASVSVAVAAVSLWGLVAWWMGGTPRPASPLGHHNLLAAWLVLTIPLVALAAWRRKGPARWALWAVVAMALVTVLLARSLTGFMALAVQALLAAWWLRPVRRWGLLVAGLAAVAALPRVVALVGGGDPSGSGRWLLAEAAWRAAAERPWLGHGPGSVGWLSARFLRPEPGLSLPSEAVGQLHALPLDLLFEVGGIGVAVVVVMVILFVRARRRSGSLSASLEGRDFAVAAAIALAGGSATALGNGWLEVPALPAAVALAAATWLAAQNGSGAAAAELDDGSRATERRWPSRLYAAVALCLLLPLGAARWRFDAAVAATSSEPRGRALAQAVALDPALPLYRARWALITEEDGGVTGATTQAWRATQARRAAQDAVGVPALWVLAGHLEREAGLAGAESSLRLALALDPLAAYAPFELALTGTLPEREQARCAARALLAEPRLATAVAFEPQPRLLARAAAEIRAWEGVDAGWRETLALWLEAEREPSLPVDAPIGLDDPSVGRLVYGAEGGSGDRIAGGVSLYSFRRSPWAIGWLEVPVRLERARALDLPPATRLATSSATAFPPDRCAP